VLPVTALPLCAGRDQLRADPSLGVGVMTLKRLRVFVARDARALAARQRGGVAVREARQLGLDQRRLDALPPPCARRQAEREVGADGEMREQQIVLEQDADALALRRQGRDVHAAQPHLALATQAGVQRNATSGSASICR